MKQLSLTSVLEVLPIPPTCTIAGFGLRSRHCLWIESTDQVQRPTHKKTARLLERAIRTSFLYGVLMDGGDLFRRPQHLGGIGLVRNNAN